MDNYNGHLQHKDGSKDEDEARLSVGNGLSIDMRISGGAYAGSHGQQMQLEVWFET